MREVIFTPTDDAELGTMWVPDAEGGAVRLIGFKAANEDNVMTVLMTWNQAEMLHRLLGEVLDVTAEDLKPRQRRP